MVRKAKYNTGTITGFKGSWSSGMAMLVIDGKDIPCDNGHTVRTLASMFPDIIGTGHTVNVQALVGKRVHWVYDDMGLMLGGIAPAE
jgi:hypothetical protein